MWNLTIAAFGQNNEKPHMYSLNNEQIRYFVVHRKLTKWKCLASRPVGIKLWPISDIENKTIFNKTEMVTKQWAMECHIRYSLLVESDFSFDVFAIRLD